MDLEEKLINKFTKGDLITVKRISPLPKINLLLVDIRKQTILDVGTTLTISLWLNKMSQYNKPD